MASVALPYIIYPDIGPTTGDGAMTLDASGEKAAFVFYAPKAGNIAKVHFRLGTVTTGQTLQASLQDVSLTTGDPDEVADQSGTVAVANSDDDSFKTVTFGSARTVAFNDLLACVIEFSGTVGNLNVSRSALSNYGAVSNCTYAAHKTGGTWTKITSPGILAVEYDDGSFAPIYSLSPGTTASQMFDSTATPDEYALKFQLPFACKVGGIAWAGRYADCEVVLYAADGTTALGTAVLDGNVVSSGGDFQFHGRFADVTIASATTYYASVKPTTASSLRLHYLSVGAAAWLGQMPGGQNLHLSTRTNAGSWTDTTTTRPFISLLITEIDDGVGGGGGGSGGLHMGGLGMTGIGVF